MTENFRITAVSDQSTLQNLADDWDQLVRDSRSFSPMLTHAWISSYIQRRIRPRQRWTCLCAHRGDRLVGVLPLVLTPARRFGIKFEIASYPHDDTTPHGDVIVHDDEDADLIRALVDKAFELFPKAQMLRIGGLTDDSNVHRALPVGRSYQLVTTGEGCFLPVPEAFDTFRGTLSKNFRSNLNKARNHARRAGTVTFNIDNTSANRSAFLDQFMEIEAANWKGEEGSAIKASDDLQKWYATLIPRLEESGFLEWQTLCIDDEFVAANMCIRTPRKVFLWKLGYRDSYAKCSPGSLLLQHVIETEAERETLDSIELLTSYNWYSNWNMLARPHQSITFFRRGPKARFLSLASRLRAWLKSRRGGKRERVNRHGSE